MPDSPTLTNVRALRRQAGISQTTTIALLLFLGGSKVADYVRSPDDIKAIQADVSTLKSEVSELKQEIEILLARKPTTLP